MDSYEDLIKQIKLDFLKFEITEDFFTEFNVDRHFNNYTQEEVTVTMKYLRPRHTKSRRFFEKPSQNNISFPYDVTTTAGTVPLTFHVESKL